MNNEFLPAYKVYQQAIDLELYYAFVDLVVHTSQEEKAWEIYRNIVDTQIWQQKEEEQNYFEAYNLRYPGEVLERFEEKLGKDVRIIRALALALGKTPCASVRQYVCWKSARQFSPDGPSDFQWRCVPARGSLSVGNRYAPPTRPAG